MLGLRLVYLFPWKQYEREFRRKTVEQLKSYVYERLETITKIERRWIVIIAGMGFFADAYAIFAINLVVPMIGVVYFQGAMPQSVQTGLITATLGGSMLGQLLFGFAADWLGRRKTYGWELIVTIVATIGVASASSGISGIIPQQGIYAVNGTYPSNGTYFIGGDYYDSATYTANGIDAWNGSLSIIGGLIAWRFVLGLAIGADYPLSAIICSEFAPKRHRARMLSAVFFFQPLGQLAATLVALVVTAICEKTLINYDPAHCYQHPGCLRTVDIMWRVIIGFGTVLPAIAMGFRFAILESPRYLVDVRNKGVKAAAQLNIMGDGSLMRVQPSSSEDIETRVLSTSMTEEREGEEEEEEGGEEKEGEEEEEGAPHNLRSLRVDLHRYFWTQGHGWTLFATSLCWFCVDLPFYGLGMNSTTIVSQIWNDEKPKDDNLYTIFFKNSWESLIFVSIGATFGGLLTFFSVKYFGERNIQITGFAALFLLFILIGILLPILMDRGHDQVIVALYVMCQIFFNFGPNTTSYLIAAEFFPTRYRASSHAISAASGKLGSVIAQAIIYSVSIGPSPDASTNASINGILPIQDWLRRPLLGFSPLMLVGLLATIFLIPDTYGKDGRPLSLEQLAAEHGRPNNLLSRITRARFETTKQSKDNTINNSISKGKGKAVETPPTRTVSGGQQDYHSYEMTTIGTAL